MSHEEFCSLKELKNQRVQLTFTDGESVTAALVSATVDFDQSQHLVYDLIAEPVNTASGKVSYYASGDELVSCVPLS